jgi:hypothetical protein
MVGSVHEKSEVDSPDSQQKILKIVFGSREARRG